MVEVAFAGTARQKNNRPIAPAAPPKNLKPLLKRASFFIVFYLLIRHDGYDMVLV
ncbi:MAG: hypothetical protein HZA10_06755 [Nitrospirae bacterium]|nr:hypothetical protein [Nitrospirota bacterium]